MESVIIFQTTGKENPTEAGFSGEGFFQSFARIL
jgi:hypothetical protein